MRREGIRGDLKRGGTEGGGKLSVFTLGVSVQDACRALRSSGAWISAAPNARVAGGEGRDRASYVMVGRHGLTTNRCPAEVGRADDAK
jgi:hypothetical protein